MQDIIDICQCGKGVEVITVKGVHVAPMPSRDNTWFVKSGEELPLYDPHTRVYKVGSIGASLIFNNMIIRMLQNKTQVLQ